nr:MAG TPA: hypothetical protein [Bacteriophage sp.]
MPYAIEIFRNFTFPFIIIYQSILSDHSKLFFNVSIVELPISQNRKRCLTNFI